MYLYDGLLFNEAYINSIRVEELEHSGCPEAVGVAYANGHIGVYINTERGTKWIGYINCSDFLGALKLAQDLYIGKQSYEESIKKMLEEKKTKEREK